jgi:hypothetical protein
MKEQCNTCETYGKERAQENLRRAGIVGWRISFASREPAIIMPEGREHYQNMQKYFLVMPRAQFFVSALSLFLSPPTCDIWAGRKLSYSSVMRAPHLNTNAKY